MATDFLALVDQIKSQYQQDDRPWIVGFSGGKDSTAVLQLVFQALIELPRQMRVKPVHVVSNDTLVEIPQVAATVLDSLNKIEVAAKRLELPISVALTRPEVEDTFFVSLIGRGYPSPNSHFRWCTERMKIDPTSRYIKQVVDEHGEVVILLGARKAESATRAQALANRVIEGSILRRHSTLPRCLVYTPIEEWVTQEVWAYLLAVPSLWGGDNRALFQLYSRADGGECPMVIDTTTPSCGNSRFGCWVCTVVERDKSMEGFIESGEERLEPLLEFRNFLKQVRARRDWREKVRKNGQLWNQKGEEVWGPFTLEARKEILRRLLEAEKQVGFQLISLDELLLIQKLWQQGGRSYEGVQADTLFSVARIVNKQRGVIMNTGLNELNRLREMEEEVAREKSIDAETLRRMVAKMEEYSETHRAHGLPDDVLNILKDDLENQAAGVRK